MIIILIKIPNFMCPKIRWVVAAERSDNLRSFFPKSFGFAWRMPVTASIFRAASFSIHWWFGLQWSLTRKAWMPSLSGRLDEKERKFLPIFKIVSKYWILLIAIKLNFYWCFAFCSCRSRFLFICPPSPERSFISPLESMLHVPMMMLPFLCCGKR